MGILSFSVASLALGCASPPVEETPSSAGSTAPSITGKAPRATGAFPSVILLEPETPAEPPAPGEPLVMDQFGNAFHPKVLLARPGQPVDFKNSEDVLHNVHVVETATGKTEFNVGTPVVGSYRHRFERAGAYDVSCEIHPSMAALIVVTTAPFTAIADSDGNFELTGVPAGAYRLTSWNLDPAKRVEKRITIQDRSQQLSLVSP